MWQNGQSCCLDSGILYGHRFESRLLHFQFSSLLNGLGKAAEDGPGAWAAAPTSETQKKLLLLAQPGVAAAIRGVKQQMEARSLALAPLPV